DASVRIPPDELVLYLAEDLGLEADELDLAHNLALQVKQKMREMPGCLLCDIVRELNTLRGPLEHFLKVVNDQKGFEPQKGVVTLSTVHKAKGLEWDTVYLIGVTSYEYPSTVKDKFKGSRWFLEDDISDPLSIVKAELKELRGETVKDPIYTSKIDQISERLRLLYVGITRARRNLLMSCHSKDRFGRDTRPSAALLALEEFINGERTRYESGKE
ncbi:MAG: 3'-5' exonuclease, partial [Bacillota bacterium]